MTTLFRTIDNKKNNIVAAVKNTASYASVMSKAQMEANLADIQNKVDDLFDYVKDI